MVKRWVWRILWGTSLFLSVASLGLWIRSYFRAYMINRYVGLGNEFDGEDREIFAVSNRGWFFVATNWSQHHYETNPNPHHIGKRWITLTIPPPDNYKPPAYFRMNYRRPDGGYGKSSGFDARVISAAHFVIYSRYKGDRTTRVTWAATVPHWLVALIFLGPPGIRLRQAMKARRARHLIAAGRCASCGYDLRGIQGSCPECGQESLRESLSDAPSPQPSTQGRGS